MTMGLEARQQCRCREMALLRRSRKRSSWRCATRLMLFVLLLQVITPNRFAPPCLQLPSITPVSASGIITDLIYTTIERIFPDDGIESDSETRTLGIVEISEMRARDIKRRLARSHGYDPDELSRMIDKKELINALSYEEHKVYQQEADRRKWRRFKATAIYTCVAVLAVMFWPLLRHAFEVAHVNVVVYTDRRRHEIRRCRDFHSFKGYFGIFLLFIIDLLSFWLSVSVLLSWVMSSKYFFPVPNIPIRPAQLLTINGGDAGALGKYGINVGPMVISWSFRFLNGKVEGMIGRAMADALNRQKKRERDEMKRIRKEERAKEKEARRVAREQAKLAKEERRNTPWDDDDSSEDGSDGERSYGMSSSNVVHENLTSFDEFDTNYNRAREPAAGSYSNMEDLD